MKFTKVALLGVAAILAAGGLVACGGGSGSTEIVVSGPEEQSAWLQTQLNAFNAKRQAEGKSTVTFKTMVLSEGSVDGTITDWKAGPDVYAYASDKIQPLYAAGALSTVSDAAADMIEDDMGSEALNAVKIGGKVVSYPYAGDNGYFLYYNASFFAGNEDKLESLETLLPYLETNDVKMTYNVKDAFVGAGVMFSFGNRYNVALSPAGAITSITADWDNDNGVKAAKAMNMIVSSSAVINDTWGIAPTNTGEQKVVAAVDGSWNASSFQTALGSDYACTVLPTVTVDDTTAHLGGFLGYKQYGVNPQRHNSTEEMAIKHELATFLVSETVQRARFDTFKVAPTLASLASSTEVQNTPHIKAILAQKPYCVPQTVVAPKIWQAPLDLYNELTQATTTPDYTALMLAFNESVKTIA